MTENTLSYNPHWENNGFRFLRPFMQHAEMTKEEACEILHILPESMSAKVNNNRFSLEDALALVCGKGYAISIQDKDGNTIISMEEDK